MSSNWTPPFRAENEWVIDARGVTVARSYGMGMTMQRAADFAKAADAAIGWIADAVDAFMALKDFDAAFSLAEAGMWKLKLQIQNMVQWLMRISEDFDIEGLPAAQAFSEAASAAYWLASQVGPNQRRFAAAPGADVGSIGVYRMHEDYSEMLAQDGVAVTFIGTPEFKTEASPYAPLTEEAYDHHMAQVQATYEQFASAVARGRGVSASAVGEKFGKGRMFHASQAASMGLVDRVATLGQLAGEMLGGAVQATASEAAMLQDELCHAWETGEVGITVTQYSGHIADRLRVARKALFRP
jgi:hypothetical protein